jgi:SAM-dependent methyltransferase
MYLPFRDNIFSLVISRNVIEHVHNPYLMFRELIRVSKRKVVVKCPHRRGDPLSGNGRLWNKQHHINSFNQTWFRSMAKKLDLACEAEVTRYKFIPHEYLPLIQLPLEMTITILKPKPRTSLTLSYNVEPFLDTQVESSQVAVSHR